MQKDESLALAMPLDASGAPLTLMKGMVRQAATGVHPEDTFIICTVICGVTHHQLMVKPVVT